MLKKIVALLISISFISLFCINIYADDSLDMSEWRFIQLESNGTNTISKFYSRVDANKYAFCIEPGAAFNKNLAYSKENYYDEYIFNVVKAYDKYGLNLDNENFEEVGNYNYYIACQILIWEYLTGESYTFDVDYSSYKTDILNYIKRMNMPLLMASSVNNEVYESEVGETKLINEDFTDYEINADEGVDVISNDENGLTYQITSEEPEYKYMELSPKYDPKDYAYCYHSEISQDLYCFEGTYEQPKPMFLSFLTLSKSPNYVDIYYSKKDTNNNPIAGAEFTVYEILNDDFDEEITFINTSTDINLFEALIENYHNYNNLTIEVSERYQDYLHDGIINTNEVGYFPYKIYDNDQLIKEGRCYVSDDNSQTGGTDRKYNVKNVYRGFSEDVDVNTIEGLDYNKQYFLCESEPKKGYIYTHNACSLVDTSNYQSNVFSFINGYRTYTLKLMKQSPYEVLLDGAKFKITYLDGNQYKDIYLTTGYLNIQRINNKRYLIYKYENDSNAKVVKFDGDYYSTKDIQEGKYYYYQSDESTIDYQKLNDEYTYVLKGGFKIEGLPYSSSLTIEELQAPKGFMITDPIYEVSPNIAYSEITFRNFRVNEFDILAKKQFKIPKTCIEN